MGGRQVGLECWGATITQEWPEDSQAQPGTPSNPPRAFKLDAVSTVCGQSVRAHPATPAHVAGKRATLKMWVGAEWLGGGRRGFPELLTFRV